MPWLSPTLSRPATRQGPPAALRPPGAVLALAAGVAVLALVYWVGGVAVGTDSSVYRAGALAMWRGEPLYGPLPEATGGLLFTYPPVAALLFGPFAVLPGPLVWGLLGVFSLLALGTVVRVALGPAGHRLRWWGWAVVVGAGLAAEPVWRTLGFGQVNLVLLALVVVDVLVLRGSRGAGLLTGLAAAVKLTPLVFVGHLWLTGRRADAGRALAAFGLCHAVGGVLLPGDSLRYWTVVVLDPSRPGDNAYWGNQSLNGLVHRLAGGADWALVLSGALGVGVLAVGALVVSGRWRAAAPLDPLAALLVTAGCGLLVSPVSWTHHWVWVVPLGCWLARPLLARPLLAAAPVARRWPPVLALAALGVVFTGWCWWLVPGGGHAELAWTPLESVVGNSYALAGLVGLAAVLSLVRRGRAADRRCEVAAAR